MKIKKSGIYKTIDNKDFGLYQQQGWEKVVAEPLPKLEEVKPVIEEEPVQEIVEEVVDEMPKSKKNRRK